MRHATRALLALVLVGCAENSVLEVEVALPAQPTGDRLFAYVQARSADMVSFDDIWAGAEAVEGTGLSADPSTLRFSIVAGGASIVRPLGIRVRLCETPDCTGLGDDLAPERRVRFERAFYQGRRTRFAISVDPIPPADDPIVEVDRCEVEGCATGSTTDFCFLDGRHMCEE